MTNENMPRRKFTANGGERADDAQAGEERAGEWPDSLEHFLQPAAARVEEYRATAVEFARREPEKALLWAVAAGYILRLLPILRIVDLALTAVRVAWKPAALFFGGRALWARMQEGSPGSNARKE